MNLSRIMIINNFSIDNLIFENNDQSTIQEILKNPIKSNSRLYLQLIYNFLYMPNKTLSKEEKDVDQNNEEIKTSFVLSLKNEQIKIGCFKDMSKFDKNTCKSLFKKYLKESKYSFSSFTQFQNFINLFGYYLYHFNDIYIMKAEILNDIQNGLVENNLKEIVGRARSEVINDLFNLALYDVTYSVMATQNNQETTIKNLNNEAIVKEETNQRIEDKFVNFDNWKFNVIIFGEKKDYFSLDMIYSDRTLILPNLKVLYKSQNYSKFIIHIEETKYFGIVWKDRVHKIDITSFLNYIQNTEDTSFFVDYRNSISEQLLDKLKEIFCTGDFKDYIIDMSKFSPKMEFFLTKLNQRLVIIENKLDSYVLSADNFFKIILIYNKLKANLPVVIMGECGCGKTSLISYMALKLLGVKILIFNIHAGITQQKFLEQIEQYFEIARAYKNEDIWLFFDEINTSESIHMISEMICKRTLLDDTIPVNLKIFAACNPYQLKLKNDEELEPLINENQKLSLTYFVDPLPKSIIEHTWNYGSLKEEDVKRYISNMLASLKLQKSELVVDLLSVSQNYIRVKEEASSVSLRDIDRFRIFYKWFKSNIKERDRIYRIPPEEDLKKYENRCIMLSIFICYIIRLNKESERAELLNKLVEVFNKYNVELNSKNLQEIFSNEQDLYFEHLNKPAFNAAPTKALKENLFAVFVCIMNKVPSLYKINETLR